MNNKRESNIELLRIVSMIMIIGLHYFNGSMGGALKYTNSGGVNWYIIRFIESMFIMSVNIFVLITGFCMINKKEVRLKKIIDLYIKLTILNVFIYITFIILKIETFSVKLLIKNSLPLLYSEYWFFKIYIALFLLIPFINSLLTRLDEREYKRLLIILIVVFSIYDSIMTNKVVNDGGYGIVNFIVIYTIGGYIRLHYKNRRSSLFWSSGYMLFSIITFGSIFIPIINNNSCNYNFITNILGAVCLFNAFNKLKIRNNFINKIASSIFGIFILHLNPYLLNIQYKIAKTHLFWNSKYMIIHFLITCISIFFIFVLLDKITEKIINLINIKTLEKIDSLKISI